MVMSWESISMGPYVKSVNGKVWCMVAVEAQHGYTIVKTLPDKESLTVKVAMQEIIREFQIAIGKGKTFVVRVHSDNDPSMLAKTKEYLRRECIEQAFTEAYDHNANAKVERKNRKLLGIFRACLVAATAGTGLYKKLWCVGLEHAAMASNQAPEAGNKSPAAKIGARLWDFQEDFQVFGARVRMWEPLEKRDDKLESVAGIGIWLGLSQTVSGAHVVSELHWDAYTRTIVCRTVSKTIVCRTVKIDNLSFPLRRVASEGQRDLTDFDLFVDQFSSGACGSNISQIQEIRKMDTSDGVVHYYVKWKGVRTPTWEPETLVKHYGGEKHIKKFLDKPSTKAKLNHIILASVIKRLELEKEQFDALEQQAKWAVEEFMKKRKVKHSKETLVEAYVKEFEAVLTKRMDEITGDERERVLNTHKVVRLRMNYEPKRDDRCKFRCIVMGHTEPREWRWYGLASCVCRKCEALGLVWCTNN